MAQQTRLDSLFSVWQDQTQPDSSRVKCYHDYIWNGILFNNPDSALVLAKGLIDYGEKHGYPLASIRGYNLKGVANLFLNDNAAALEYFQKGLAIATETANEKSTATMLGNIGNIYESQGNYPRSLEHFKKSLKIYEKLGVKKDIAVGLNNIGKIYYIQNQYTTALEYLRKSRILNEEIGDKNGVLTNLIAIGNVYLLQDNYSLALDYAEKSLALGREMNHKLAIATSLSNIGIIYSKQKEFSLALEYYQKGLTIFEELANKNGIASILGSIGHLYSRKGKQQKALDYCQKSLILSEEIESIVVQKEACQCLYDSYKAMGNGNEALVYLEKINVLDDSLNAEETSKKLQQMEFQKEMLADSIAKAEEARLVQEAHEEEVRKEKQTRNYLGGAGLLALLLAGGFYSRWRYVKKSKAIVEKEKDRSNNLLLNILPADIAEELKIYGKAEARDFDLVSILFTDFKGFTEQSAKMSAADLVNEINTCFEAFDQIMEKYGVEKIKTIGDAYMAAGGLPVPTDDSVKNTVLAALEMQEFITARSQQQAAKGAPHFEMRVGIHTGPVVAGIVGVKKFQYDIWGDTVNTASRMESSGEVGKVNISQATYELLKEKSEFNFTSRGKVEAKGKGEMDMYFVTTT